MKAPVQLMEGVNKDTVWTWNAIGKRTGAWNLAAERAGIHKGFLLNHVISELLPPREDGYRYANADPVTGQAAWYDLRVRLVKCGAGDAARPRRDFPALKPALKPAVISQYGAEFRARPDANMTDASRAAGRRKLGLVIDLDICVGCHACAVNCKEWNSGGHAAPLTDFDAYGAKSRRRLVQPHPHLRGGRGRAPGARCISRNPACIASEPACVTVCPTGASFKRAADGIVLVNEDSASAASSAPGPAPMARASSTTRSA